MDRIEQITIIGTGLIGTSCGLGLRAAGYKGHIVGVSRRIETAEHARRLGGVDTATTELGPPLRDSQLVVMAIPLHSYEQVFEELAQHDHARLVITDVGSTKQLACAHARRLLPAPERFVGSHPMAGAEQHGPGAARGNLFEGKPCSITADTDTDSNAKHTVEAFWTTLKMRLVHLTAEEHDRQVARVSHLPHALAVLLLAAQQGDLNLASTGLGDMTRLASGDPQIWLDIFTTNRDAVIQAIDVFQQVLAGFRGVLSESQDQALMDLLCQTKETRDAWIKGCGPK